MKLVALLLIQFLRGVGVGGYKDLDNEACCSSCSLSFVGN